MIKQTTIDQVMDLSVVDVIGREQELKKRGATHQGICPFHDDNGPSLMVSQSKNVYKCFACGAGGNNGIKYIMDRHSMSFPEAVKHLATNHQILFEEDESQNRPNLPSADSRDMQERLLAGTATHYAAKLAEHPEIIDYLHERGISDDLIKFFGIGFAGKDPYFIKNRVIKNGQIDNAVKCGIVSDSKKGFYDTFVGRVTIPIKDANGRLLTFGGRDMSGNYAKYINGKDSWLYNKDKVLFNLNEAKSEIKNAKFVYLCEGYFDVIGLARIGVMNAVANCGTAFTSSQATLLRRFTDKVIIFYDGDSAGIKATHATAKILLQNGFQISVINHKFQDPDDFSLSALMSINQEVEKFSQENPDADPEEYARQKIDRFAVNLSRSAMHFLDWAKEDLIFSFKEYLVKIKKDEKPKLIEKMKSLVSVSDLGDQLMINTRHDLSPFFGDYKYKVEEITPNSDEKNKQREHFLQLLKLYPEGVQEEYFVILAKEWKLTKSTITKATKNAENIVVQEDRHVEEDVKRIPRGIDQRFYLKHGFAPTEDHSGYYFIDANGGFTKAANFTIKPLFHIYGEDNKRYIEVRKGQQVFTLLLDSVCFSSVDMLDKALWNEGGLVASTMSKPQFNLLREYWGDKFPKCYELNKLGHQDEGFFAFCNNVYNGKLSSYSELGIYQHEDKNFLSPSITESLKDLRGGENVYSNDKYLEYKNSPVSIDAYFSLFHKVFGENSYYGIGFIFLTIFRDIALRKAKIPFLYNYGPTQMGKSTFSEAILYFFFSGKDSQGQMIKPLQIGSSTDYAFSQYMERYQNLPAVMNELDVESTPYERITALKGIFDGEGRAKGSGIKNKTIRQVPNMSIILVGQYLVNVDDNSLVNRSIIRYFPKKEFTQLETDAFNELADLNKKGVSSLVTDIYRHRAEVSEKYDTTYPLVVSQLRSHFKEQNEMMTARLIDNYAHILSFVKIMSKLIELPFTFEEMWSNVTEHMLEHNKLLESSDIVSNFWGFVEFLIRERIIKTGFDIKVEHTDTVKILVGQEETDKHLGSFKNVMFVQLGAVHKKYAANFTKTNRQAPMTESNLRKYLQDLPAYIGTCKRTTFQDRDNQLRTSAMMFDADLLGLDLTVYFQDEPNESSEISIYVTTTPEIKSHLGMNILQFKAAIPKGIGDSENLTCKSLKTGVIDQIMVGGKLTVTGVITHKSFRKDGELIEYKVLEIEDFISLEQPAAPSHEVTQENLPF